MAINPSQQTNLTVHQMQIMCPTSAAEALHKWGQPLAWGVVQNGKVKRLIYRGKDGLLPLNFPL